MLSSLFDIRERRRDRREDKEHRREEHNQEIMTLLATLVGNSSGQTPEQADVIRAQQQIIDRLASENDRLRQERGNGRH